MANMLDVVTIPANTLLQNSKVQEYPRVSGDDPAELLVTDFKVNKVRTIQADADMDTINDAMNTYGVRLLFVVDSNDVFIGLVTATDLLGRRPVRLVTERGCSREDITARDLMTPVEQLEAVRCSDVEHSKVADVVETMQEVNRQHILVLENSDQPTIRGLLSMSQISKQLGVAVSVNSRPIGR
jgi:predicted transcriptional regulator